MLCGLGHGDDAGVADGAQCPGDRGADHVVVVGGDRGHPGEVMLGPHRVCHHLQVSDQTSHGEVDAALDQDGVAATRDSRHALTDDGLGQHGGGRGAIADNIVGFDGGFFDELGAHVLELVF